MEIPNEKIEKYLPAVENFLQSVLLEETSVEIISDVIVSGEHALQGMKETDIFLQLRDEENQPDIILVLDEQWFRLLSAIMLGVEETSNNEITRDLLKKFSSGLTGTVNSLMAEDGLSPNPADIRQFTFRQIGKQFVHNEYLLVKVEVGGLSDHNIRAELLVGYPESRSGTRELKEKSRSQPGRKGGRNPDSRHIPEQKFSPVDAGAMSSAGSVEEVVSGRHIEFEEFEDDAGQVYRNGDSSRRMDLLKDVEMDVSVELGRIELPLGKVLQLAKGSVIELEKLAGEPVDVLVNGHRIAHGEVVVIDEHFGVKISNLVTTRQRIARLK